MSGTWTRRRRGVTTSGGNSSTRGNERPITPSTQSNTQQQASMGVINQSSPISLPSPPSPSLSPVPSQ